MLDDHLYLPSTSSKASEVGETETVDQNNFNGNVTVGGNNTDQDSPELFNSAELWSTPISDDTSSQSLPHSDSSCNSRRLSQSKVSAQHSLALVEWSCLLPLFRKCGTQGCAKNVLDDDIVKSNNGAALDVVYTCETGHVNRWSSSGKICSKNQHNTCRIPFFEWFAV